MLINNLSVEMLKTLKDTKPAPIKTIANYHFF